MAREGCTWRALPVEFGHWGTVYQRFIRWQEQGVFERLFQNFLASHGVKSLMVDGTIVHVHQDGTGARKIHGTPEDQAIGHSRGGRTTKILAASDEAGKMINFKLLPGQSGESPYVPELVEGIEARDFIGDRAYDTNNMLDYLGSRSMNVVIPPKINRRVQRAYDKEKYKTRHFVENLFQKLKRFRRVATRYDKTSRSFATFIILAAVFIVTRTAKSVLREVTISGVAKTTAEVYVPEGARWNLAQPFNPTTRLAAGGVSPPG
jgi:transposase